MHCFPSKILHNVGFCLESKAGESKAGKSNDEEISIEKVEIY